MHRDRWINGGRVKIMEGWKDRKEEGREEGRKEGRVYGRMRGWVVQYIYK